MKRRKFIVSAAAAGTFLMGHRLVSGVPAAKPSVGIQLYTLRDIIPGDVPGTLQKLAEIGYAEVEFYNYSEGKVFGLSYNEFTRLANSFGLSVVSGHYASLNQTAIDNPGNWLETFEKAAELAAEAAQRYVVVPSSSGNFFQSIDGVKRLCELLNRTGEVCNKYYRRLLYHNHNMEFRKVNDQVMYDVMLSELDPTLAGMQMDIFWVVVGGGDPIQYFEKYPGRFETWHIKDRSISSPNRSTEIGSGSIDYSAIFKAAERSGMTNYFVEQEHFDIPAFESLLTSYKYTTTIAP